MANKAKPAAKTAANTDTPDVPKEFQDAPPDQRDQVQPLDELTPAESLKRDQERAKEHEKVRELEAKQDEALKEVRDRNRELRDRATRHQRSEISGSVAGINDTGDVGIYTGDARCHVTIGGKEVELDKDGVADLRSKLDQAFQAVA